MFNTLAFTFQDVINGNFFEWLITWCSNILSFIVNWVSSLIKGLYIISQLPVVAATLPSFFPVVISTSITLCLTIAIIKAVLMQDQQ